MIPRLPALPRLLLLLPLVTGCDGGGGSDSDGTGSGGDTGGQELCASQMNPTLEVGRGVGGAFEPYAPGEVVTISVAPQGGYGVPVSVHTMGLYAATDSHPILDLEIRKDGKVEGSFGDNPPLGCRSSAYGGLITGQVAGLDPGTYSSNDDLLALDGAQVEIWARVRDTNGAVAEGSQTVTLSIGG